MLWRISDFPELEHLEPQQRQSVLARVPWWTYPLIVIRALVPGILATGMCAGSFRNMTGGPSYAAIAVFLILFTALFIGLYMLQINRLRIVIRKTIAAGFFGQKPPFCFRCGYNLRGCNTLQCPECGEIIVDIG